MNKVTDAVMYLREAAEAANGKVVSITFDENAYEEIDRAYQDCAPPSIDNLSTSVMKKFMGIEIKKG